MAKIDPIRHLNDAQRADLREFKERLQAALADTDLDEATKKEYYDHCVEFRVNSLAAETTRRHALGLIDKLERINERYKKETDPVKVQEILNSYNKNKNQFDEVQKRYQMFDGYCEQEQARQNEIDRQIELAIERKKEQKQSRKL